MTLQEYIEFIGQVAIAFGGTMLLIAIVLISILGFILIFTLLYEMVKDCAETEGQSK